MIFLAETTALPDPNHFASIGWVVVILAAIAVGANQISDFFDRRSGSNKERKVTLTDEGVSKEDFQRHIDENKREHENLFSRIGGVDRGTGQKISGEVNLIHTRINSIEKSVGALEATTSLQNQTLAAINADVKRILSEMPRNEH